MEMIKRKIRIFIAEHGKSLSLIFIIIFLFIFTIKIFDNSAKSNFVSQVQISNNTIDEKEIIKNQKENIAKSKTIIKSFIANCEYGAYTEAYSTLATKTREEMYKTKDEFEIKYAKTKFNLKKEYIIENEDEDIYIIYLKENMIETGKISNTIISKVSILEENGEKKILILE